MLIRTIDELEALPDGAIIRDGYETLGEKTADGWQFPCGRDIPSQNVKIPAQLIYPRRYGDEDVERVVDAIRATPRCSIVYDEDGDPWCKDHDIEWFHDNARFPYGCQHQEHAWARAALNALEEK